MPILGDAKGQALAFVIGASVSRRHPRGDVGGVHHLGSSPVGDADWNSQFDALGDLCEIRWVQPASAHSDVVAFSR